MPPPQTATATLWGSPEGRTPWAEVRVGPNRVALLKDGFQAFPAMLEAISAARRTITLETYILVDDVIGQRFIDALCERSRAGVEVLLMFDNWGSSVAEENLAELAQSGVKVLPFAPLKLLAGLGRAFNRLRRRNHRKSLVVDGQVGFTGGLNISDDYAAVVDGGKGWRDTHVRIVGPTAQELERLFLETWLRQKGPAYERSPFNRPRAAACATISIVGNDFPLEKKAIRRAYLDAFNRAGRRILLTHAYFLPPSRMLNALVLAARRGVRVVVILAGTTDVRLVLWAARGLYPRLLRAGVEVYEWSNGRVLHAKTAVADGLWATVGSSNLDPLSLRQNLEVNAIVLDRGFAQALERMFEEDLAQCVRVTRDTVKSWGPGQRLVSWLAYQVRHWL